MDAQQISYADLVVVIRNLKPGNGAFYFFNNACELGNVNLCQACLDAGIDINVREKHSKNTLLMETIINGKLNLEIADWLINNGADINAEDPFGYTALTFACATGNYELAKFLLKNGANIRDSEINKTDLIIAVEGGKDQQIVELLLDTGFYADKKFELQTAFSSAISLGLTEIVKVLIKHGVSPNSYFGGSSALHNAVENRSVEIVRILLENGADVNAVRRDTSTEYCGWYTALDMVNNDETIYQVLEEFGGKSTTKAQKKLFDTMVHRENAYKAFDKIRKILDEC